MNEDQQQLERIETHQGTRFKMRGTRIIATEETCFHCHQQYWQPIMLVGADPIPLGHSCHPQRLGGASIINKYG